MGLPPLADGKGLMANYKFEMPALPDLQERKQEVRHATPGTFIKDRIAALAERLNADSDLAARLVIVNEALCGVTVLCYQTYPDNTLRYVDRVTHRLRIPAPWGAAGWEHWGLRKWEGETLRHILLDRQSKKLRVPPLYIYNPRHTWHLNVAVYDTLEDAERWLRRYPIEFDEWRRYTEAYRERALTVRGKYPRR